MYMDLIFTWLTISAELLRRWPSADEPAPSNLKHFDGNSFQVARSEVLQLVRAIAKVAVWRSARTYCLPDPQGMTVYRTDSQVICVFFEYCFVSDAKNITEHPWDSSLLVHRAAHMLQQSQWQVHDISSWTPWYGCWHPLVVMFKWNNVKWSCSREIWVEHELDFKISFFGCGTIRTSPTRTCGKIKRGACESSESQM